MSVNITVGLGLEGPLIDRFEPGVGAIKGGPARILSWLESQLGLEQPVTGFTERVLQYLSCLKSHDNPARFYHESLKVDALAVSRTVLAWRDQWYLAGWQGGSLTDATRRLLDITEVEVSASERVADNEGQRVQRVLVALDDVELSLVVTSVDPIEAYPAVWRSLLVRLNTNCKPPHTEVVAAAGSDLASLQQSLLSGVVPAEPLVLTGDGSIRILRAPSRSLSAAWLAQYYAALAVNLPDYRVGLLCDGDADELDGALNLQGLPRLGVTQRSAWRPVFQVLPLVMELLWEPLNPHRLLEFLTHPVGPLPRRIRQPLAEVVAKEPGIGGKRWRDEIAKMLGAELLRGDDPDNAKTAAAKLADSIEFWLGHERFAELPGATMKVIGKRAAAVADWLSGITAIVSSDPDRTDEVDLLHRAQSQVREFNEAIGQLQAQGEAVIDADNLRRLIKSVRGNGSARPDSRAELSSLLHTCSCTTAPSGCVGLVDTLI